jgi:prepilin-type N-terminal cleavage/methylation domain-containing protein
MRKARNNRGFTLIEIMIALLVFMVSLLGLVALQRASVAGTNKGREHTAAVNVTRFVMSAIQNEVASLPLQVDDTALNAADYPYLASADLPNGAWGLLPDGAGNTVDDDARLDAYMGHSGQGVYTGGMDSAPYCVMYTVQRFVPPGGTVTNPVVGLYQVRVRVTWPRWKQYMAAGEMSGDEWTDCAGRLDDTATTFEVTDWETVELSKILSREYTSKYAP